ncbi:HlyD family efflux transporter periplasmic adaptor subunit [Chloroflexia bacterium SDU3-3]|nr:HlyD family efflux transporter periplasmic adaptor subunit [Chloroflexia bacterium SDU3-3]
MRERLPKIAPVVLVVVLIVGGLWWWNGRTATASEAQGLTGSGTIEAEEILITSEVAGRVQELQADEGQEVAQGALLARLDRALLDAQRAQAAAAVDVAQANLDLLKAGARTEEVAQAEAAVEQAQAARDGAAKGYENAQAMLKNPQELNAQVAQARSNRDAAQRALEKLKAGTRAEDIAVAQSSAEQSQANLQATRDRLSATKTQAEAQVAQAADALTQAQARYAQAKANWDRAQETGNDPMVPKVTNTTNGKKTDNKLSDGQRESYYSQYVQAQAALSQAEEAVRTAQVAAEAARQAEVTGVQAAEQQQAAADATLSKAKAGATAEDLRQSQTNLSNAQRLLDIASSTAANPLQLHAAADAAKAQLDSADAQLASAKARLEQTKNGARVEQVAVSEAQLKQAQAALQQIDVQLSKTELHAPRSGIILTRPIHEGEQANVGTTLMTIGTLQTVKLTVYIAESEIGRVRLGQKVNVVVDSFPGRTFEGTVSYIAGEAQFTPRNVQTSQERATTVFAVKVQLPNEDHALKPGMPADATILE